MEEINKIYKKGAGIIYFFMTIDISDRNNNFYGNRFIKNNDTSTRVLYGNDGELAGIQATVLVEAVDT